MGYREWDRRASGWLRKHWSVWLVIVLVIALLLFGVDFSTPAVAIRSAVLLAGLLVLVALTVVLFVRRGRGHAGLDQSAE